MKIKVAVIFGGKSAEHEVSLKSATNIFNAIDNTEFDKILIGVDKNGVWHYNATYSHSDINLYENDYFQHSTEIYLCNNGKLAEKQNGKLLNQFDVAFPIIHGTFGEDGTLQGFLKSLNIPFVGPDILGSAICMDKDVTKRLLRDSDIPIANFFAVKKSDASKFSFEEAGTKLGLPLFVKPANAGSSVGVSKVTDQDSFDIALRAAFKYDNKILVEEAVMGKEVECAILGNENPQASGIGEIVPSKDFYSYEAKYIHADGAKLKIPAAIDEQISKELKSVAVKAFKAVCCEGMARVDFFLRKDNTFVLNEINTLPGFTEISMYPKLWEYSGKKYSELISDLIRYSVERHKRDSELITTN